jgi:hypothetical protein
MVVDGPVADELDLWNAGNGLQVRMEDGFLGPASLVVSMTVALRFRIEMLSSELSFYMQSIKVSQTLVRAYCCSGVMVQSRNRSTSC